MRKLTKKDRDSGFIHNLDRSAIFRNQNTNLDSDIWTGKKCFKCKLSGQVTMQINPKKEELLADQNPGTEANSGSGASQKKNEENSKFILDYIPLCCEEDLELIAFYFAKDKEEKSS